MGGQQGSLSLSHRNWGLLGLDPQSHTTTCLVLEEDPKAQGGPAIPWHLLQSVSGLQKTMPLVRILLRPAVSLSQPCRLPSPCHHVPLPSFKLHGSKVRRPFWSLPLRHFPAGAKLVVTEQVAGNCVHPHVRLPPYKHTRWAAM